MYNKIEMPDVVRIESSGSCNFKCLHCPNGLNNPNRGNLHIDLFESIIKQFKENNYVPRVVVLYHGGEPLLNKNLFDYIERFKKMGVSKTVIVTNGSLLNSDNINKLIKSGIDEIRISFDGNSPEENDSIRCGGNFKKDSINALNMIIETQNTDINIVIANTRIYSKQEIENNVFEKFEAPKYLIEKFSGYKNVRFQSFPAMVWPGYKSIDYFDRIEFDEIENINYCPAAFETLSIMANGDIVPCCYDIVGEMVLGNVKREGIFNIVKGRRKEFLDSIINNNPCNTCKSCILYKKQYLLYKSEQVTFK